MMAGNQKVTDNIKMLAATGRLPHAILVEGEQGAGKTQLAYFIAAGALCTDQARPCGHCRPCELTEKRIHPDIELYAPEKTVFRVEQIRQITQSAYIKPHEGRCKVFILQNCELMNPAAQNALLKTLEEPPENVMFVLLTRSAAALLPTIRSRCVLFTLAGQGGPTAEDTEAQKRSEQAEQILQLAAGGKTLEIAKVLFGVEKDRQAAKQLLQQLRSRLAELLRQKAAGQRIVPLFSVKELLGFCNAVDAALQSLIANGNTQLALTLLVAKTENLEYCSTEENVLY